MNYRPLVPLTMSRARHALDIAPYFELEAGSLPKHCYPFPVTIEGRGPAAPEETFRMICWCGVDGCLG